MKSPVRLARRRGVVLIAVLVVVAMLALTAYTFSSFVVAENDLSVADWRRAQARLSAESAVQFVAATLAAQERGEATPDCFDNKLYFSDLKIRPQDSKASGMALEESSEAARAAVFVRRYEGFGTTVSSASAQVQPTSGTELPIRFGWEREAGRIHLSRWLATDPAALRRALLTLPKANEMLVDALLDGMDADEDLRPAGAERREYESRPLPTMPRNAPPDDLDELLAVRGMTRELWFGSPDGREPGWRQFFTLRSRERNVDRRGAPRLWLNDPDVEKLCEQLAKEFDRELADFVRAFRTSTPAGRVFRSAWEIVDGNAVTATKAVASPIRSTDQDLAEKLPPLLDRITATAAPDFVGRLDLLSTSPSALELLPLTQVQKQAIAERRSAMHGAAATATPNGAGLTQRAERPIPTLAWLLTERILTIEEIIAIEPHVTACSPVVRFEAVGYFDNRREAVRGEFVLDGSLPFPQVVERHPHGPFGIGMSLEQLRNGELSVASGVR